MKIYLEAQSVEVWNVVINGSFIHTTIINGASQPRSEEEWSEGDNKILLHDKKSKFFIVSTLRMYDLFRVSNCKIVKEIWGTCKFDNKKDKKSRRVYIVWGDKDVSTNDQNKE